MGDMADDFAAMKAHKQQQHADWKRKNMEILNASTLIFVTTNGGETLCFREPNKPRVDFYPSTGRWRIPGTSITFSGGASKFLRWYRSMNA